MTRGVVHALWPFAILPIFAVTFGRSAADTGTARGPAACEHRAERPSAPAAGRLEQCLALDPSDVEAMIELGGLLEESDHTERAEALYRRALSLEPHDARAHVRLGRLLLARGDRKGARGEGELALHWHINDAAAVRLVDEARAR